MSDTTNSLNAMELLKHGLEEQVRAILLEEVVDKLITDYEKLIRESIIPIIEGITIGKVECHRSLDFFRNEFKVFVEMKKK